MACSLGLVLGDLLHRRSGLHAVEPGAKVGVLLVKVWSLIPKNEAEHAIPHDEGKVCKSALVAHQVLLALESVVEHHGHAIDFVLVALLGRGKLLRMEFVEPCCLAKVRALT